MSMTNQHEHAAPAQDENSIIAERRAKLAHTLFSRIKIESFDS
jgi:hypothetical protein